MAVALLAALGFLSSPWLGLAVPLIAAIGLAAWWAWTELPNSFEHGPDRAELAERERWQRMMEGE